MGDHLSQVLREEGAMVMELAFTEKVIYLILLLYRLHFKRGAGINKA
jgi:hypothetical protein